MKKAFLLVVAAAILLFTCGSVCHAESEEIDVAIYHEDIVDIELESGNIHRSFMRHSIGSGDSAANRFGIRVLRNGQEVDVSGCSCYGYFQDPQGNNIALTGNGTVNGAVAYVTLPQACYNYEGQFCLAIKLIGDGITGTMRIVDGVIDNTNTGSAVAPTSTVPTYQEILNQYDAMTAATAAANTCTAETFDATKVYSAGKYVINNGTLYKLTADHAANTTWANTLKVEVKFGNELSEVADDFDGIITDVSSKEKTDWVLGRRLQTNVTTINPAGSSASSGYAYILTPCKNGDKFRITAKSNHAFGVVFTDSNYNVKQTITPEDMTNNIAYAEQDGYILCNTSSQSQMELVRLEKYTDLLGKVNEIEGWKDEIFGSNLPIIDLELEQGYYLSGGFGGETSSARWRTSKALPAGTYEITVKNSNYVFYWVEYVSDSSGTVIINSRNASISYTGQNPFYLTFSRITPESGTTADEINSVFTVRRRQINNSIEARVERLYSTQEIVFMGDSLFGMERGQYSVPLLCGYYTGATAHNCAIGGTAAHGHTNAFQYYDLDNLTDAIIAGDFSDQIAHESDTGIPEYVPDVLTELQGIDFATINLLVISIGTNDWSMAFGTNSEIISEIEAIVNKMLTAYPQMRIMLMAPTYRFFMNDSYQFVDDSDTHENANGSTLKSLVDQYSEIREACHVPVVFPYYDLGIGRYNRSQWFNTNDGTHPNEQGRFELAKYLSEYLKRLMYR